MLTKSFKTFFLVFAMNNMDAGFSMNVFFRQASVFFAQSKFLLATIQVEFFCLFVVVFFISGYQIMSSTSPAVVVLCGTQVNPVALEYTLNDSFV